jgi:transcriptional regulator with XRE-family HTH domain
MEHDRDSFFTDPASHNMNKGMGGYLKELREERGITPEELCSVTRMDAAAYRKVETGERPVDIVMLSRLNMFYGAMIDLSMLDPTIQYSAEELTFLGLCTKCNKECPFFHIDLAL